MEILFIWFICGVISAVVASNKHRNAFGWFCLGMLLGPFGIILALVMQAKTSEVERDLRAHGLIRDCPFCAETIKAAAVKCRFCGSDLPPVNHTNTPEASQDRSLRQVSEDIHAWIDRLPPVQSPHNASR